SDGSPGATAGTSRSSWRGGAPASYAHTCPRSTRSIAPPKPFASSPIAKRRARSSSPSATADRHGKAPERNGQEESEQQRARHADAERRPRKPGLVDTQSDRVPNDGPERAGDADPQAPHVLLQDEREVGAISGPTPRLSASSIAVVSTERLSAQAWATASPT